MLGLIKKDLVTIKSNAKTFIVLTIIYFVMAIANGTDFSFMFPFMALIVFMATFSYDDYNNFHAYAITLPKGRENIVRSKYIGTIIMLIFSIIPALLFGLITSQINSDLEFGSMIFSTLGCVFGVAILTSLVYPLFFKYGTEKARIMMLVVSLAFTGLFSLILAPIANDENASLKLEQFLNQYGLILATILLIVFLYSSYLISKKVYSKREF